MWEFFLRKIAPFIINNYEKLYYTPESTDPGTTYNLLNCFYLKTNFQNVVFSPFFEEKKSSPPFILEIKFWAVPYSLNPVPGHIYPRKTGPEHRQGAKISFWRKGEDFFWEKEWMP